MAERLTIRASARRCPACHEPLLEGEPTWTCVDDHARIHEACGELSAACTAIGCGLILTERGPSLPTSITRVTDALAPREAGLPRADDAARLELALGWGLELAERKRAARKARIQLGALGSSAATVLVAASAWDTRGDILSTNPLPLFLLLVGIVSLCVGLVPSRFVEVTREEEALRGVAGCEAHRDRALVALEAARQKGPLVEQRLREALEARLKAWLKASRPRG